MSRMADKVGVVKDDSLIVEGSRQLHFKEEKNEQGKRLEDGMEWSGWGNNNYTMFNFFLVFFFFFWICFCTIRTHGFDLDRGGVGESI